MRPVLFFGLLLSGCAHTGGAVPDAERPGHSNSFSRSGPRPTGTHVAAQQVEARPAYEPVDAGAWGGGGEGDDGGGDDGEAGPVFEPAAAETGSDDQPNES